MSIRSAVLAGTFVLLAAPFAAQAMPLQSKPASDGPLTLVAGGCGPGFHRGPYGGCRPNRGWGPPGYGPRVYGQRCVVREHRTPYGWRRVRVCD
jgi:hypothetical protein